VTRILNSIASFAADGGLRESASWISLRQHIYVALTSQHPLTINLTNYRYSSVFQRSDDEAWANRIIFIFASILTQIFLPDGERISVSKWDELDAQITSWDSSKPWHFSPLHVGESTPAPTSPGQKSSFWPEVLVCNPAQGKENIMCITAYAKSASSSGWPSALLPSEDYIGYLRPSPLEARLQFLSAKAIFRGMLHCLIYMQMRTFLTTVNRMSFE
jgi:hypothetical protein